MIRNIIFINHIFIKNQQDQNERSLWSENIYINYFLQEHAHT